MRAADLCLQGLLTLILALVRVVPPAWIEPLGAAFARVLQVLARKDVKRLRENVQRVYQLPPKSHFSAMFERQVFRHHIVCGLETIRILMEPDLIHLQGFDAFAALIRQSERAGKGHLLLTGHLGSWELCAYYGQKAATRPLSVLAKPPKRPALQQALEGFRANLGARVLWTDRKTLLRDMLGVLRRGEGLGFVMDQKPEGRRGPLVTFLGQPTPFVGGPAAMAVRTECAVISLFCVREGAFRYRLVSEALLDAGHGVADEQAMTQRFADVIDQAIRVYPEQWTWNYKRWR